MKRRLTIVGGLSLFPITFFALWIAQPTHPLDPIDAANFNRIKIGMTDEEVRTLFGFPDPIAIDFTDDGVATRWYRTNGDTIVVLFEIDKKGVWFVKDKRCEFPTIWDQLEKWWNEDPLVPSNARRLREAA